MNKIKKQLIVLSSPSGGGKSSIAKNILNKYTDFVFSISATTRTMRPGEQNGKEYYFLSKEEFEKKIQDGELVEFEEIYGNFYGTLRSEIESKIEENKIILFDVDVKGALSLRKAFPEKSLLIFISPPDLETLEKRLINRKTETEEQLKLRKERFTLEMEKRFDFDYIVFNDSLTEAIEDTLSIIEYEIINV